MVDENRYTGTGRYFHLPVRNRHERESDEPKVFHFRVCCTPAWRCHQEFICCWKMHRFLSDLLLPSSIEFSADTLGSSSLHLPTVGQVGPSLEINIRDISFDESGEPVLLWQIPRPRTRSAAIIPCDYLIRSVEYFGDRP